jgi:FtsP/CotA-like multicopper oxidase with cupredoxin domain
MSTMSRRDVLRGAVALGAGLMVGNTRMLAQLGGSETTKPDGDEPAKAETVAAVAAVAGASRIVTPGGRTDTGKVINGVRVFHLVCEEVYHEFAPGLKAHCWGYNGGVHGPTLECIEGERIRIYVTNRLPAPTSLHPHGILLPMGMDGVSGLNQRPIRPGETFRYEFVLRQFGTFMYHSHFDEGTQMAMGQMGLIVIHPRKGYTNQPNRDYAMMLSEWMVKVGTSRPDANAMEGFNVLTINGKAFPGTVPLLASLGDRVRMRFGNLSAMDHHSIHLHGYYFKVIATDGGQIPEAGQWPETTVLVPVGSTRDVEFIANNPGDWAMHCHMTHHVMNQMGHGAPNMVGVDGDKLDAAVGPLVPGYMTMGQTGMGDMMQMEVPPNSIPMGGGQGPYDAIGMGGMFTIVKVRDRIDGNQDPGWYTPPEGTAVGPASADDLLRDGIQS